MAIPKICGIETEYGIQIRGSESNPILASSLLISSYIAATSKKSDAQGIKWDFCDEQPAIDARGYSYEDSFAPEIESHLVNAVLTNGARYYVDHAHPEISTPECRTALEVLAFDCAAEEIVRRSMKLAQPFLGLQAEMVLYKNNSDGKGNSYGCHENFLVSREVPFGRLVAQITPHFVTRQIFAGAGKVGCEIPGVSEREVPYQISQRADFFEEEVGLETTLRRPIVNTRDEPHCDPQKYRRLHVIVGDANMSQTATLLKVGTTSLILAMIEDEALAVDLSLAHAVPAIRQVSYELDIQWALLEMASKYSISHGLECLGGQDDGEQILQLWETVLNGLSREPESVAHLVDWVAKKRLVDGYSQRHDLQPGDSRLIAPNDSSQRHPARLRRDWTIHRLFYSLNFLTIRG
ncbi:MAG: Pup deamidase, partial [Actinomycetota bacterium]